MNRTCKIVLAALSLFIISTSALAGDHRKSSGLSLSYGTNGSHQNRLGHLSKPKQHDSYSKYNKRHSYSHKPYSYPKYRRQPRYGHRSFGYSYGYNSYHYQQPNYYQKHHSQQICQPVTKVVIDKHGKYYGVDATLCYDNYRE